MTGLFKVSSRLFVVVDLASANSLLEVVGWRLCVSQRNFQSLVRLLSR